MPDVQGNRQSKGVTYKNSDVVRIVNEYIHSSRDRDIAVDRLVNGLTIEQLAEKYERTPRAMQTKVAKLQAIVFRYL